MRLLLFFLSFAAYSLHAGPIGLNGFSPSATLITFDDVTGGNCNLCGPSVVNQYSGLGVVFNNPSFPGQETADTNLTYGIPNASPVNALFVQQAGGQTGVLPFQILFSSPMTKVGFDFGSSSDSFLELEAYDKNNTLIEMLTFVGESTAIGAGGFAGIAEAGGIQRLDVSYHPFFDPSHDYNFSIDNLIFETVPEPSTIALCALGLVSLVLGLKRAPHCQKSL
jgi:hypothetical protein